MKLGSNINKFKDLASAGCQWNHQNCQNNFFKACVCYFYQIFIFSPNDSLFRSWDNRIFLFPSFPLFLPVGHSFRRWSKINLIVYDAIICLNKNSKTHFVWYLENEKRYDTETCPSMEYQIKNIFMEKSCRKYATKASPRPLYNFGK